MAFFGSNSLMKREDLSDLSLNASKRNQWTPDATALEEAAFHLIFAYDRLQQGFTDHDKLIAEHSVYAGIGFTNEKFVMQKSTLGRDTYPVIQRKDDYIITPPSRIKGQLFYLEQEEFRELDTCAKNGVEWRRELIKIDVPFNKLRKLPSFEDGGRHKAEYEAVYGTAHPSITTLHTRSVKAFCYIGVDEYWDDLITGYQFKNVNRYQARRPDIGEYYHFTKRELFDD